MSDARLVFRQADGGEWSIPVTPEAVDEIRELTPKLAVTFGVDVRFMAAAGEKGSDDE